MSHPYIRDDDLLAALTKKAVADVTAAASPYRQAPKPSTIGAAPQRTTAERGAARRLAFANAVGQRPASTAIGLTRLLATLGGGEDVGRTLAAMKAKDAGGALTSGALAATGLLPFNLPRRARAGLRILPDLPRGERVSKVALRMERAGMPEVAERLRDFMRDSKVKRVQYHYTNAPDYDVPRIVGEGFHVGSPEHAAGRFVDMATSGGSVLPLDLHKARIVAGGQPRTIQLAVNLKNPLLVPDAGSWSSKQLTNYLHKRGVLSKSEAEAVLGDWTYLRRLLQEKGWDGLVYPNAAEGLTRQHKMAGVTSGLSYSVFSPNQVKSILGNTTFDPSKPNIYAALAGLGLLPFAALGATKESRNARERK